MAATLLQSRYTHRYCWCPYIIPTLCVDYFTLKEKTQTDYNINFHNFNFCKKLYFLKMLQPAAANIAEYLLHRISLKVAESGFLKWLLFIIFCDKILLTLVGSTYTRESPSHKYNIWVKYLQDLPSDQFSAITQSVRSFKDISWWVLHGNAITKNFVGNYISWLMSPC